MAKVIAICNQKGGVGKTTTAVNLSAYLAHAGQRCLIVDFDPQANASSALGQNPLMVEQSVYHGVLGQASARDLVQPTALPNLHIVPAAAHLAGLLVELVSVPDREYFLRKFLHTVRHEYDYIFVDLPPSLSLLTVNGLAASDELLVPVQAEYYSLEGIGQLLNTVDLIRTNLYHPLSVTGAVVTMYDKRERLSRDIQNNLRAHFPHYVFSQVIPRSVSLAEAPSFSRPVMLYKPDSSGAQAYQGLAQEFLTLEERKRQECVPLSSDNFGNFNIIPTPTP